MINVKYTWNTSRWEAVAKNQGKFGRLNWQSEFEANQNYLERPRLTINKLIN